jgi:hypothetical protein
MAKENASSAEFVGERRLGELAEGEEHLALRPQYHWTDQKIHVDAFICLLASSWPG